MANWPERLYSRRQFLGGLGAAGAVAALPLPRSGPPARSPVRRSVGAPTSFDPGVAARAGSVGFFDDFRRELPGPALRRWGKSYGVGVVGTTSFGSHAGSGTAGVGAGALTAGGMVVALSGHDRHGAVRGRIRTRDSFEFEAGRRYLLEFRVAGSQVGGRDGVLPQALIARVPGASTKVRLPARAAFRPIRVEFTPTETAVSPIEFAALGAPGSGGLLLDSVQLSEVA